MTSECLRDLAHRLADGGVAAVETELTELAAVALWHGATPAVLDALLDERLPDVVRQRAFTRICRELPDLCEIIVPREYESHYHRGVATPG